LLSATCASAQFSKLDDLASQVVKEVKPLKPHLIAVADFRSADGTAALQGHYFAWMVSGYLEERGKKKFSVANHVDFDKDLAMLHIPVTALAPGSSLQALAPQIGVDIVVVGTIEKRDKSYVLQATLVRLSDRKSLTTLNQTIVVDDFLESFVIPFPADVARSVRSGGLKGTNLPRCIHCPDPSYTDLARAKKVQGSCVLEVLISANGDPQQIRPLRLLGYGLDQQAFNAIKKWKFKPPTREDGTPVPIIVPVEVTFRLF